MRRIGQRELFDVGLGAMNLSLGPSREEAIRVIHAALDAGIELIDTADVYAPSADAIGHNERCIAAAEVGERAFIATKGGVRREGDAWIHDGRPSHLRAACEASLARLGRIDLHYLHAVDERVPIEESVGELARLRDEGKLAHIGVSNVDRAALERAIAVAPIAAVQNELSPYRPDDGGVIELCQQRGIAFVAHSPMGGWRAGSTAHLPALRELADELGTTPFGAVLAWLLSASPCVIPIPGASRAENVRASAAAATLRLRAEQRERFARRLA